MDNQKIVDIVGKTDRSIICTIWTGPNYYIDCFPMDGIEAQIRYAKECGIHLSIEDAIRTRHVDDMYFLCRTEELSRSLLDSWVRWFQELDAASGDPSQASNIEK